MKFSNPIELFKFLFPVDEDDEENDYYVESSAVSDDEFDELPNNYSVEDLLENDFMDAELVE